MGRTKTLPVQVKLKYGLKRAPVCVGLIEYVQSFLLYAASNFYCTEYRTLARLLERTYEISILF